MILNFITWNVDPILIHFGDGGIRWYGLLWAIGIYLCYLVQVKLYKHEGCPADWADKIFVWMALGGIIGARVGHCLFYEWYDGHNPYLTHPWWMLKIWEGGLSSHGGAIGLIIATLGINKVHFSKQPQYHSDYYWIMDKLVIGVCITATLIRLGNLMNSEIYGYPTDLPWGFIFVRDGQTVPCHPTQIYEMLYCIVAGIVTWLMYWKGHCYKRPGLIYGVFLIIIFLTRFLLEFIKNDQELFEADMVLNMGQWLSIPFIIWGVYAIIRAYKRPALP